MRKQFLGLLVAIQFAASLVASGEPLRIRNNVFDGKTMTQDNTLYASLAPLTIAIGLSESRCGDGMWVGMGAPPADLTNVPSGQVWVQGQLVPLVSGDGGDQYVPAELFCKALGGSCRRDKVDHGLNLILPTTFAQITQVASAPVVDNSPKVAVKLPPPPADPAAYFVTQYPSLNNPQGNWSNGNCGPTCIAMAALAFRRVPPGMLPGDRQGLILWCRESMTGGNVDESRGTTFHQVERAATQLQLNPRLVRRFSGIDAELNHGRLVAIAGKVGKLGFPSKGDGGHLILIVGQTAKDYIINDPGGFYKVPGTHLSREKLKAYFDFAVSLGPP